MIDSFEAARRLGDAELRRLLEAGRPEERVWAIWALALRSANNIGGIAVHEDPDPGVRRNLAVVLAGHGELELLVALAHRDPAPEVRAAALALVSRLAIDGSLQPELVVERALADRPEVKIAVLGTVFDDAPEWLRQLARQLLGDRDSDVRYEAFEALVRIGELDAALMWLEELPDMETRLALMRWSARGNAHYCAQQLARSSRRLRRLLVESVRAPTWRELGPAIDGDPLLLRTLLHREVGELEHVPVTPLVRATLADDRGGWLGAVRERLAELEHAPEELIPHLPALQELCVRRLAELARYQPDPDDYEQNDEIADARVGLEATLDQVSRLIVH